jgi:hypothetical protein
MTGSGAVLLLAAPTSYRLAAFERAARRLQLPVVRGIDVPGDRIECQDGVLALPFAKPDLAVVDLSARIWSGELSAILAVDDSAVGLATSVNNAVGRSHNEPGSELAAQDKRLMRDRFAATGLPGPIVRHGRLDADPAEIVAELHYPVVVKPTCLNGSRGVIRANDTEELIAAHSRTRQLLLDLGFSPQDEVILIESFITGFEVAVEGLMTNGRLRVLALFDKPDPLDGPFFEETIYVTPSRLPSRVRAQIARTTRRMALAVGLRHGPIHAELRVNDDGVWPIEVAGRSIGGMCSTVLEFGSGISLEELILRHAIGLETSAARTNGRAAGVMMIPIPARGMFRGVRNQAEALAVPGITGIEISAPANAPIIPLPEGASYLGFIFARGSSPGEVEASLRFAHEQLEIVIEPMLVLNLV